MGTILMLKKRDYKYRILGRLLYHGDFYSRGCDGLKKKKTLYPSLSLNNQGSTSHLFWAQLMIGWSTFVTNYEVQVMDTTRER